MLGWDEMTMDDYVLAKQPTSPFNTSSSNLKNSNLGKPNRCYSISNSPIFHSALSVVDIISN